VQKHDHCNPAFISHTARSAIRLDFAADIVLFSARISHCLLLSTSFPYMNSSEPTEKLQKVLARAGLGSRRTIETWIQEGRIKVNQEVAELGRRVSERDQIELDGRKISMHALAPAAQQVICYHKPVGEVCTRDDPEGRATVFKRLPKLTHSRWVAVGRLDVNTSGLLLLTTDGELANRLMHPSYQLEREYAVRVLGQVDEAMIQRLLEGVVLEDGEAKFERILDAGGQGANHWYHVVLQEGRKREVRRLWESQGLQVSRLIRIRYGAVTLPRGLREGHQQALTPAELAPLYQSVGLTPPSEATPAAATSRTPRQLSSPSKPRSESPRGRKTQNTRRFRR